MTQWIDADQQMNLLEERFSVIRKEGFVPFFYCDEIT